MHNKYADHFNEWFCKCDSRNISEFEWERHISKSNINFTRCTAIGITGIAHFRLFSHWPSFEFPPFPSLEFPPFPWIISLTLCCCSLLVRLYDQIASKIYFRHLMKTSFLIEFYPESSEKSSAKYKLTWHCPLSSTIHHYFVVF